MTYIAAIIVPEGIVALADTRITVGDEKLHNEKYWMQEDPAKGNYFALFAGNRSWTDEVIRFLDRELDWSRASTVNDLSGELGRYFSRLRAEYRETLAAGVAFDIGLIVGGMGPADTRQDLRFVYQAGNHITYSEYAPYFASGQSMYGKFILDDGVAAGGETTLHQAVSAVLLSFHATQTSVTTVDYPLHLLIYPSQDGRIHKMLLPHSELQPFRDHWRRELGGFLTEAWLPAPLRESLGSNQSA